MSQVNTLAPPAEVGGVLKSMPLLKQVNLERQCDFWSVFSDLPDRPSQVVLA